MQGELAIQKGDFTVAVDQLRKAKRMVGFAMTYGNSSQKSFGGPGSGSAGSGWVAGIGTSSLSQSLKVPSCALHPFTPSSPIHSVP